MSDFFTSLFIAVGVVTLVRLFAFYIIAVVRELMQSAKLQQAHRRRKRAFRPLVTVIVNDLSAKGLYECLMSIAESTYTDTHVVIMTGAKARTMKTIKRVKTAFPDFSPTVLTARAKRSKAALPARALTAVRGGFCMQISADQIVEKTAIQKAVAEFTVKSVNAVAFQTRELSYTSIRSALHAIGTSAAIWQRSAQTHNFFTTPLLVRKQLLKKQTSFENNEIVQASAVVHSGATVFLNPSSAWTRLSPLLLAAMVVSLALNGQLFYAYLVGASLTLLAFMTVIEMPKLHVFDRVNFLLLSPLLWLYLCMPAAPAVQKSAVR